MMKRPYTYTVLRYVHDPVTQEFVNVGVAVHCASGVGGGTYFRGATRHTIGRMREMFPDLRRSDFTSAMSAIDRAMDRLARRLSEEGMLPTEGNALSFAHKVLPADASSLQWSPLGSGLTADPNLAFERLFNRFVTQYDERSTVRRTDEELWKPVRLQLEARGVPVTLESKTISGGGDKVDFAHAWKNGAWHAYEPLSFDLANADGIAQKAHRWLGQLASVAPEATEPFHTHFFVGKPSDSALEPAYRRAVGILRKAPRADVFEEADIDEFVNRIEDEMRHHVS